MRKSNSLIAILVIALSLGLAGIDNAEAKRFGGARSFGSKSFYNKPYRRSALPSKTNRSASQQQAYQKNNALKQNMSRRGGLWGMLGALAIGGLLGSLLFGGAFQGLNLMDILLFAGIAYLLYRLFAARKPQPAYQRNTLDDTDSFSKSQSPFSTEQSTTPKSTSPFNTDVLFGNQSAAQNPQEADFEAPLTLPAGFDEQDFLAGAKNAFYALQKAWDNRDLAEIRGLTTDKVFAEIQDQLNEMTEANQTEVLKLEAELLDVRERDDKLEAVVLFDSIMRENPDEAAEQIREVWHFIKPKRAIQPKWYLDGIQQLED
jgi:predicted lipid-binding transport protein (Tim44 family)